MGVWIREYVSSGGWRGVFIRHAHTTRTHILTYVILQSRPCRLNSCMSGVITLSFRPSRDTKVRRADLDVKN